MGGLLLGSRFIWNSTVISEWLLSNHFSIGGVVM